MNNENAPPPALLDQLIATLLAVFSVPVRFVLRALARRAVVKARFAQVLQMCRENGWPLRRDGEDDATVEARVKYLLWIARDPWAARRRMVRGLRGWEAHRYAYCMTVLCAPPRAMGCALKDAFSFDEPALDTS